MGTQILRPPLTAIVRFKARRFTRARTPVRAG